jgi:hypothetical protein
LRKNLSPDIVFHIVGTKADLVHHDPSLRAVPFERCIAFLSEHLSSEPNLAIAAMSPSSKRSSSFWGQDVGWDSCHEISSLDGEGVEEVFRVITRKLIDQRNRQDDEQVLSLQPERPHTQPQGEATGSMTGSFRLSLGEHRRSWLRFPHGPPTTESEAPEIVPVAQETPSKGRCC